MKHIFVTGGVVSGLGKGICAASLGRLLKQRGFRVKNQKFDPYFNVDPGTMSPFQHGEVFVTDDGAETDLDLGHYERFVDESLTGNASVSSGKVFWNVLNRERQGGYLGGTVQIIPHVTDEIKRRIYAMDDGETDIIITEVGGTVGDIESQPYLEAIRQVAAEKGRENVLYIHVPLVVSIPGTGELKSKPTQHSVKELLSVGIQPDILVCRTDSPLPEDLRRKIALFCNMEEDCVIQNLTASTLYEVPLLLEREGLCRVACRKLGLPQREPDLAEWTALVQRINGVHKTVQIALVGKYTGLHDAYLSVAEALFHAGTACDARVNIKWVDSEGLTAENWRRVLWPGTPTVPPTSPSGTGTGMSSTTSSDRSCRTPGCGWRGCPRTGIWWRSWRNPPIPGLWGCSSTQSSRAVPTGPIRCLWALCRRLWTGRDDGGGPWRIHWNAETAPAPRGRENPSVFREEFYGFLYQHGYLVLQRQPDQFQRGHRRAAGRPDHHQDGGIRRLPARRHGDLCGDPQQYRHGGPDGADSDRQSGRQLRGRRDRVSPGLCAGQRPLL